MKFIIRIDVLLAMGLLIDFAESLRAIHIQGDRGEYWTVFYDDPQSQPSASSKCQSFNYQLASLDTQLNYTDILSRVAKNYSVIAQMHEMRDITNDQLLGLLDTIYFNFDQLIDKVTQETTSLINQVIFNVTNYIATENPSNIANLQLFNSTRVDWLTTFGNNTLTWINQYKTQVRNELTSLVTTSLSRTLNWQNQYRTWPYDYVIENYKNSYLSIETKNQISNSRVNLINNLNTYSNQIINLWNNIRNSNPIYSLPSSITSYFTTLFDNFKAKLDAIRTECTNLQTNLANAYENKIQYLINGFLYGDAPNK